MLPTAMPARSREEHQLREQPTVGESPRVTVCVPTIGRIAFLASTRDSIAAQTFRDFEVLVLDNASPPDARVILEQWAAGDPRVRILRVEERVPMFQNFNRGIRAARGVYVTFCHDDDTVAASFLERQLAFMDAHPRVGFSGSNYDYIDENGAVTERRAPVARTEVWKGPRYIRALIRSGRNPLTMQSVFFRRAALSPSGIDEDLSPYYGDYVVLMRMAESWDVGLVAESLVKVRRHAAQASAGFPFSRGMRMRADVLRAYVDELAARRPTDKALVTELRASVALAHRTGLLWGWASAQDIVEARACIDGLGSTVIDVAVGAVLRGIDRIAPPATDNRRRLSNGMRRVATRGRSSP